MIEKCLHKKPTHISFQHCLERDSSNNSAMSARRGSASDAQKSSQIYTAPAQIESLKMGEYFSVALSTRGYVYTWGSNDKGQCGVNSEANHIFDPVAVSSSKSTLSKAC